MNRLVEKIFLEKVFFLLQLQWSFLSVPLIGGMIFLVPCVSFFDDRVLDGTLDWISAIPFEYQEAVIRAAITLKLCQFEESGAIIAAMTTSIPGRGSNFLLLCHHSFCFKSAPIHKEIGTIGNRLVANGNGLFGITITIRYCWLRDSFHVVRAMNRLSETRTMESYITFLSNIVSACRGFCL